MSEGTTGDGPSTFAHRAHQAVGDPKLQRALRVATENLYTLRRSRFSELGAEGDAYRRRARAIREQVIARLPEYVEQFAAAAGRQGCRVHFAQDREEAGAIAVEIARANAARLAIKMKSMLTEELHIREALEAAGVQAVETDLGEWILQLANETPAHLIVPAVHKDTDQVKQLFDEHLGPAPESDPKALVERAQRALRRYFVEADIGITGVNFAVAKTGTLVLVSNEGNGRLCTSGPPVHIAFVPIEKLVPTIPDAVLMTQMLIQSATGQKLTSYVHFITGPRREGEADGPRELHIILVDNGRSARLGGPLEEALLCIRCGACLNACPVYRRVGGHAYGSVYPGPIGIPVTPIVRGLDARSDEMAHASSLCGACEEVCPVRIDIPRMILELRRERVAARRLPWLERLAFAGYAALMRRPRLYRLALWLGARLALLFARQGRIEHAPGLGRWTSSRTLRAPARVPLHRRLRRGR